MSNKRLLEQLKRERKAREGKDKSPLSFDKFCAKHKQEYENNFKALGSVEDIEDEELQQYASKIQKQLNIEEDYRNRSIAKAKNSIKKLVESKKVSATPKVERMIYEAHSIVVDKIIELSRGEKIVGSHAHAFYVLKKLDPVVIANASLIYLMDNIVYSHVDGKRLSSAAVGIGKLIEAELLCKELNEVAPNYMYTVKQYLIEANTNNSNHILRTFRAAAKNIHLTWHPWTAQEAGQIGAPIIEACLETGLFKTIDKWHNNRRHIDIQLEDEIHEIIMGLINNPILNMIHPPMIVKPTKHYDMYCGGYLCNFGYRNTYVNPFLNTDEMKRVSKHFDNAEQLKEVLNRLQEVPYKINNTILDYILEARKLGIGLGMPATVQSPKPVWVLRDIPIQSFNEETKIKFKEWKNAMSDWYLAEKRRMSKLINISITIKTALEFRNEPELYFPTCLDFRYRIYYKSTMNPQGTDLQKALLLFANPKRLGERGLFWLKVHIANCFGYDKHTFNLRAEWVDTNLDRLLQILDNPLDSPLLLEADSPWMMLAALLELQEALKMANPEDFISYLPIGMDATNSVGQHYSAMLRDPIGGKLTNLFYQGRDTKADLYIEVKNRTDEKLDELINSKESTEEEKALAIYWRNEHPITRNIVKKPTMTFFYAGTFMSALRYIRTEAKELGYPDLEGYPLKKLCVFITKYVRQSIQELLPAATDGMKFLSKLARGIPNDKYMEWITPLGGLVLNKYPEREVKRIYLECMNRMSLMVFNLSEYKNNSIKGSTAIAPNFIHSLDATHLGMTVLEHTGDIMAIHDSFSTHARDVDELHEVVRRTFFLLHSENDFIKMIWEQAEKKECNTNKIDLPIIGDLDLYKILNSLFFFC